MQREETRFDGARGIGIFTRAWLPAGEPLASIVIAHGVAEHSGRYEALASRLASRGYAVHALDHRGHGQSQGRRANVERFDWLLLDLDRLIGEARQKHPAQPLVLIGHSMGGALACLYAIRNAAKLDGLVLSGPALGAGAAVPRLQRLLIRVLSALVPNLGVLSLPATTISRDPAVVHDYEQDPLVYRGALPARTVAELLGAMKRIADGIDGIRLPVLVLHGTADVLAELAVMQPLYERMTLADKTIHLYDGLFHEVFNEPERERVIGDLEQWLARLVETRERGHR